MKNVLLIIFAATALAIASPANAGREIIVDAGDNCINNGHDVENTYTFIGGMVSSAGVIDLGNGMKFAPLVNSKNNYSASDVTVRTGYIDESVFTYSPKDPDPSSFSCGAAFTQYSFSDLFAAQDIQVDPNTHVLQFVYDSSVSFSGATALFMTAGFNTQIKLDANPSPLIAADSFGSALDFCYRPGVGAVEYGNPGNKVASLSQCELALAALPPPAPVTTVPEPAGMALLALGGGLLITMAARRTRRPAVSPSTVDHGAFRLGAV